MGSMGSKKAVTLTFPLAPKLDEWWMQTEAWALTLCLAASMKVASVTGAFELMPPRNCHSMSVLSAR